MSRKQVREVFFYLDYYQKFYNTLPWKVQLKFDWTIELIETEQHIPKKYFKHLTDTDGLFEIRVDYGGNTYRVFSFFDKGKLIILINGFQKKTQKTPKKEIRLAEKLKMQYFHEKK